MDLSDLSGRAPRGDRGSTDGHPARLFGRFLRPLRGPFDHRRSEPPARELHRDTQKIWNTWTGGVVIRVKAKGKRQKASRRRDAERAALALRCCILLLPFAFLCLCLCKRSASPPALLIPSTTSRTSSTTRGRAELDRRIRALRATTGGRGGGGHRADLPAVRRHQRVPRPKVSRTAARDRREGQGQRPHRARAKNDRQVKIEVGYDLEGFIPDGFAGETIRDAIRPAFRQEQYGQGLLTGNEPPHQSYRGAARRHLVRHPGRRGGPGTGLLNASLRRRFLDHHRGVDVARTNRQAAQTLLGSRPWSNGRAGWGRSAAAASAAAAAASAAGAAGSAAAGSAASAAAARRRRSLGAGKRRDLVICDFVIW